MDYSTYQCQDDEQVVNASIAHVHHPSEHAEACCYEGQEVDDNDEGGKRPVAGHRIDVVRRPCADDTERRVQSTSHFARSEI